MVRLRAGPLKGLVACPEGIQAGRMQQESNSNRPTCELRQIHRDARESNDEIAQPAGRSDRFLSFHGHRHTIQTVASSRVSQESRA